MNIHLPEYFYWGKNIVMQPPFGNLYYFIYCFSRSKVLIKDTFDNASCWGDIRLNRCWDSIKSFTALTIEKSAMQPS
jgi:hypothetical protein